LHNENGPAFQTYYKNGQLEYKSYWLNGKSHNENGPAIESYYDNGQLEYKLYYIKGQRHNPNGPAVERYNPNGILQRKEYWLNGKLLSEQKFNNLQIPKITIQINNKKYKLIPD
jgi:antitoxin component YwqK of YwqJK toxin-antitoxin module